MSLHVTAVVTCHDYERFLPEALRSVLEQDDPAELLDVVVVDDGSADGSLAIARAAADAHPGRVTVLSGPNEGYVAASARGYPSSRAGPTCVRASACPPGAPSRCSEVATRAPPGVPP